MVTALASSPYQLAHDGSQPNGFFDWRYSRSEGSIMVSKEKRATLLRIGAVQLLISFFVVIALVVHHQGNSSSSAKASNTPVSLDQIRDIELRRVTGDAPEAVKDITVAKSLWAKQPAIVYVVRRPGCPLW
jgi:hypothetical protein